jgi:hypothetical protein
MTLSDARAELVGHLQSARTRLVKIGFMGTLLVFRAKHQLTSRVMTLVGFASSAFMLPCQ